MNPVIQYVAGAVIAAGVVGAGTKVFDTSSTTATLMRIEDKVDKLGDRVAHIEGHLDAKPAR